MNIGMTDQAFSSRRQGEGAEAGKGVRSLPLAGLIETLARSNEKPAAQSNVFLPPSRFAGCPPADLIKTGALSHANSSCAVQFSLTVLG